MDHPPGPVIGRPVRGMQQKRPHDHHTSFGHGATELGWVVVWYGVAKALVHYDREIFSAGEIISGPSLKHLAAGMATWWLVRMFGGKYHQSK